MRLRVAAIVLQSLLFVPNNWMKLFEASALINFNALFSFLFLSFFFLPKMICSEPWQRGNALIKHVNGIALSANLVSSVFLHGWLTALAIVEPAGRISWIRCRRVLFYVCLCRLTRIWQAKCQSAASMHGQALTSWIRSVAPTMPARLQVQLASAAADRADASSCDDRRSGPYLSLRWWNDDKLLFWWIWTWWHEGSTWKKEQKPRRRDLNRLRDQECHLAIKFSHNFYQSAKPNFDVFYRFYASGSFLFRRAILEVNLTFDVFWESDILSVIHMILF